MRKLRFILILLSVLLAGACTRLDEQKTALNIYVRLPEQETTKAAVDKDAWSTLFAKETRINDLRIWVFVNEADGLPAGTLLGYLEPKQLNVTDGKVQKFTVPLDKTVASKIKTVDVYVLGNSSPLALMGLGEKTTPAELDALKLTGNQFGIDDGIPTTTDVTDAVGLPYTAVGKKLSLSGSGADLSVANVELVRAVSKVQFVFCQIQDGDTLPVNFKITSLKLDKDLIPTEEYLFNDNDKPESNPKIGKNYVSSELSFNNLLPVKKEVAGSTTPSGYKYNNEPDYLDKINTALINGEVTGMAPCYLRESDKALSGEIQYTVDNVTKEPVKFSMASGQKFVRNSCWVVYFYFNNDILTVSVSPTNWTSGGEYEIIGE